MNTPVPIATAAAGVDSFIIQLFIVVRPVFIVLTSLASVTAKQTVHKMKIIVIVKKSILLNILHFLSRGLLNVTHDW